MAERSQGSDEGESKPSRAEQNAQELRCVLDAFGPEGVRPMARWYEPITGIGADNLPIGLAFSASVRWAVLPEVAKHPYVAQITLEFGESVRLGQPAQQRVFDCVEAEAESPTKVSVVQPATPTDRVPVVIELEVAHLPTTRPCASGA